MSRRDSVVRDFQFSAAQLIGTNPALFRCDTDYELLRVDVIAAVLGANGGAGTISIYKAPSGTAIGSGTAMLAAPLALDAGGANAANTTITPKLSTVAGATKAARDTWIGIKGAGNLTGLTGLAITLILRQKFTPDAGLR